MQSNSATSSPGGRANPVCAVRAHKFTADVLSWGTVEYEFGTSRNTADGLNHYFMLYAKGPRHFGGFAYVWPSSGKVMFRLTREVIEGYEHAAVRNLSGRRDYEVIVFLNSDDAHAEALELAEKALAKVQELG